MSTAQRNRSSRVAAEIGRDCIAVRVRLLNRAITRLYDSALRPHGITIGQLNLLSSIANLQPIPSGRLADVLSMEISTLSRNARLMRDEGWIDIAHADRGNGRVLTATRAGERKLEELKPAWMHAQEQAAELMGTQTTASIKRLVDKHLAEQIAQV